MLWSDNGSAFDIDATRLFPKRWSVRIRAHVADIWLWEKRAIAK